MSAQQLIVAGSTGRIGRALLPYFDDYRISTPRRDDLTGPGLVQLRERLRQDAAPVDAILNLAGKAHVGRRESAAEALPALHESNVLLPLRLASLASDLDTNFIHLSSTKAAVDDESDGYAHSKRSAEMRLSEEFEADFLSRGKALVAVRIPATLAPPFDAGKLGLLQRVSPLIPGLPIVMPAIGVGTLAQLIRALLSDSAPGFAVREVARSERATLAQVKQALSASGAA